MTQLPPIAPPKLAVVQNSLIIPAGVGASSPKPPPSTRPVVDAPLNPAKKEAALDDLFTSPTAALERVVKTTQEISTTTFEPGEAGLKAALLGSGKLADASMQLQVAGAELAKQGASRELRANIIVGATALAGAASQLAMAPQILSKSQTGAELLGPALEATGAHARVALEVLTKAQSQAANPSPAGYL